MQKKVQHNQLPIFLLGFMGSGKTHWGNQWANNLKLPFTDLDKLIEQNEQMSIADIFEKKGEDYFRQQETAALRMLKKEASIVSCGGGTPCFNDNMSWMNKNGLTVFIDASPRFLLNNILREPHVRPLTKNMNEAELLFFIETKLLQRKQFYMQAKIILPAQEITIDSLNKIIQHHA
ncbi:MAG TPA: shikimate kinase [Ferruginibacter sp.]|nr:shikimate kinase [Ferruginibacter sp.]HRE63146.1 shikimate kinase [Ferruginibacter sp.]